MDKELLFKARTQEADVEIPGVGTVRVRGLTRAEVFLMQKTKTDDVAAYERKLLATGMVDPELTGDEVRRWQEACPAGELDAVVDRIRTLSGIGDDADKSGVQADGDESGDGVRALPGGEAEHDGGGPSGADG